MFLFRIFFLLLWSLLPLGVWGSSLSQQIEKSEQDIVDFRKKILFFFEQERELKSFNKRISCFIPGEPSLQLHEEDLLKIASCSPSGDIIKQNDRGNHPVFSFNGAHFKAATQQHGLDPLRELAVYFLQKMMVGKGVPPSFLMGAVVSQNRRVLLQVSQTVEGSSFHETLNYYLSLEGKRPSKKIESKSLTNFLLISFLTCPQDAKPDNFVIDSHHRLSCIDNDQNLVLDLSISSRKDSPSIYDDFDWGSDSSADKSTESPSSLNTLKSQLEDISVDINLRNIFCFDDIFMDQIVDEKTWNRIQGLSPYALMIEWLAILDQNNRLYEDFQKKMLSEERTSKDESVPFPPLLTLRELDMKVLFQRLKTLCALDISPDKRTFHHIFSLLSPLPSLYYERLSQEYQNPLKALKDLYQTSFPFESYITEKEYVDDSKFLHEVTELWKRKYLDTENKERISPKEIARCLFQNKLPLYEDIKLQGLTSRGLTFWQDVCYEKSIFRPWESVLEPHKKMIESSKSSWKILSHNMGPEISFNIDSLKEDPDLIIKEENLSFENPNPTFDFEREYASHTLTNLMMGRGALDPLLIQRGNKRLLILQKPRFSGNLLVCKDNEDLLAKLDCQSTSEMLLISMITNIILDGPENFFIQQSDCTCKEACKCQKQYHLVRFNHQNSLSHTFEGICSFLFFLESMNHKIHPDCLSKIIYKDPKYVEKNYKEMMEKGPFLGVYRAWEAIKIQSRCTIDSLWGEFKKRTSFLSLDRKLIHRLKDRLYHLHDFLWDYSFLNKETLVMETRLTHADVFSFLKPDLRESYKDFLGKGYKKESWDKFYLPNEDKTLEQSNAYISGKSVEEYGDEFVVVGENVPLQKKICLKEKIENNEDFDFFVKNLEFIPEYKRRNTISHSNLFSITDEVLVDNFFGKIGGCKNKSLFLRNFTILKNKHLEKINFKYLQSLSLDSCPEITDQFFEILSKNIDSNLIELFLVNLPQVKKFGQEPYKGWFGTVTEQSFRFPFLRSLTFLNMPNLESVFIDCPKLYKEYLIIDKTTQSEIKKNNLDKIRSIKDIKTKTSEVFLSDLSTKNPTDASLRQFLEILSLAQKSGKQVVFPFVCADLNGCSENLRKRYYENIIHSALDFYFESRDDSLLNQTPLSFLLKNHFRDWNEKRSSILYSGEELSFLDLQTLGATYQKPQNENILLQLDLGKMNNISIERNFQNFLPLLQGSIKDLYLNDIRFSLQQWKSMWPLLDKMTNLERLVLSRMNFPLTLLKDLADLVAEKMKKLTFLGLSENHLKAGNIVPIRDLLSHPSLETVDLTYNHFNDETAQSFLRFVGKENRMPSFLFKGNDMSLPLQNQINRSFVASLLARAFDQKEEVCLDYLTRLNVSKKLQDYIKDVYRNPDKALVISYLQKINPQSLYVLGEGLVHQASKKNSLILEECLFNIGDFPELYKAHLSRISDLSHLSFQESHLTQEDSSFIGFMLKNNPSLEKINLKNNHFDAESFQKIFNNMNNLKDLKKLDIQGTLDRQIEDSPFFHQSILDVFEKCSHLSKFFWDEDFFPDSLNQQIKARLRDRNLIEIGKIRRYFESKQIFITPQNIVMLFQDLGIKQNKIAEYFGISQSNVSSIKNGYVSVTGEKFTSNLNLVTPDNLEKEFLSTPRFFVKRYDLNEKKYNLIKKEKGFLFLLLSQPVKNPYCFRQEGFNQFKRDFLRGFHNNAIDLDYIRTPDTLITKLSVAFYQQPCPDVIKSLALALFYFKTEGFSNKMTTIDYFNQSFNNEQNSDFLYFVGQTYFDLKKHQKSFLEESFIYFSKASDKNAHACYCLAQFYKYGMGCKKDEEAYEKFLDKASKMGKGHVQASYELGLIYWNKYYKEAKNQKYKRKRKLVFKYFDSAAQKGHIDAKVYVSLCQKKGFGTEKNPTKAFDKLLEIKECHHQRALYYLGRFYEKAIGCKKDLAKAIDAYQEAKALGHQKAAKRLKVLNPPVV